MACRILLAQNSKRQCATWLCADCEELLEPAGAVPDGVHSMYSYEGILRDIIRDIKFRQKKNHALALGRLWGFNMVETGAINRLSDPRGGLRDSTLTPVPMHPNKQRIRGFNQAFLMAKGVAEALRLPLENTLMRTVDTPPQAGLHPARRVENVSGAFEVARGCTVLKKSYILVDDIYTTGASVNECARILYENGAANVTIMTLTATKKRGQS
jgi:ComF family protein